MSMVTAVSHPPACLDGHATHARMTRQRIEAAPRAVVSVTDDAIWMAEEGEIHRIANELRIDHPDLVALRVAHRQHLPGMPRR